MEKSFTIGPNEENIVTTIFTWYGLEKYLHNGETIFSKWSLSLKSSREFKVGDNQVKIDVSAYSSDFYTKVYLDGELYIEELFPEVKEKVLMSKQKRWSWKNVIIWFFISFIGAILYKYLKL